MNMRTNHDKNIDPVCGVKVNPAIAAAKTSYNGANIYFCTKICKAVFDSNPKKFMPGKPKGFWSRYIARLNRTTGGKPPSCCS